MATKIDNFPTNARNAKYDWTSWFDGNVWKLAEGEDYNVPTQSFRGALYAAKTRMGVEVKTAKQTKDGKVFTIIQMVGKAEPAPTTAAAVKPTPKPRKRAAAKPKAPAAKK